MTEEPSIQKEPLAPNAKKIEKTVFLSYRRKNSAWAIAIYSDLVKNGYDVFFDFNSIASGDFEQVILGSIRARAHFLVVLTPDALDRCNEPNDWLRREIETAIDEKRNIIPLMLEGFDFGNPGVSNKLIGKLALLKRYNGLLVPTPYFAAAMTRLRDEFLNVPLSAVLHPLSNRAEEVARAEQNAADSALMLESIDTADLSPSSKPEYEIDYSKCISDKVVKYDDASWHLEGDFPEGMSEEQGFIHIGMYLGWLIDHDLLSEEFREEFQSEIAGFKARKISGTDIIKVLDGQLVSDELNAEGNAFSQDYYEKYTKDFSKLTESAKMSSDYSVKDTWANYEIIRNMIETKYIRWKARIKKSWADESDESGKKAWWKFWQ